jgi:hypothetical protein
MKDSYKILRKILESRGGINKKNSIEFLRPDVVIKHKTGVKYTVASVDLPEDGKPSVLVYRYYGSSSDKKMFLRIKDNFKDYELA